MKRLTLDETWVLCLKMWKWIAKEVKNGRSDISNLKAGWLEQNNLKGVLDDCFFCEYTEKRNKDCDICPAVKIDKDFHCSHIEYDFYIKPIAFYKKLCELNKLRLAKKRKVG